jgi:hypothetical protein
MLEKRKGDCKLSTETAERGARGGLKVKWLQDAGKSVCSAVHEKPLD